MTPAPLVLQEASWNPYYAHLALKLAAASKSHRFTLQYCLWDQVGAHRLPYTLAALDCISCCTLTRSKYSTVATPSGLIPHDLATQ